MRTLLFFMRCLVRRFQKVRRSHMGTKNKILIVDDSSMNREFLADILSEQYDIEEAEDGEQALLLLTKGAHRYSLVLLDLVMPKMDGFDVLGYMNRYHWIEDLPVIIITSENDISHIKRAYSCGATDFIQRPYDVAVVQQRVKNTIRLYDKQRRMADTIAKKYYENEKNTSLMISLLSNIVEFRNGESGPHIIHIKAITKLLLHQLIQKNTHYVLSYSDISIICTAAALHDIGKITIPDEILNKPGRLTPEEFEIMKTHSMTGAQILRDLPDQQNEPLIKTAYDICRWHHERWDGRGYPDGLVGDAIPISAQVVSLADVYDALTSERCYKKAFPHEKAVQMILNGECGAFNPLLLECMLDVEAQLKALIAQSDFSQATYDPQNLKDEIARNNDMTLMQDMMRRLAFAEDKATFLADHITDSCFFYHVDPSMLELSPAAAHLFGLTDRMIEPEKDPHFLSSIHKNDIAHLITFANRIPIEALDYSYETTISLNGKETPCMLICRNIRCADNRALCGISGLIRIKK